MPLSVKISSTYPRMLVSLFCRLTFLQMLIFAMFAGFIVIRQQTAICVYL